MQTALMCWVLRMHHALSQDLCKHLYLHRVAPGGNYSYPHFTGEETEIQSFVQGAQLVNGGVGVQMEVGKDTECNLLITVFYFLYHQESLIPESPDTFLRIYCILYWSVHMWIPNIISLARRKQLLCTQTADVQSNLAN